MKIETGMRDKYTQQKKKTKYKINCETIEVLSAGKNSHMKMLFI